MRVLVVEDDDMLLDATARGLRQAGLAVDEARDGDEALEMIDLYPYDVVVLDRQLPGRHGDDVCRALQALEWSPRVLMLTASGTIRDRVEGLSIGADDYLPKPFAMDELIARVHVLARRPAAGVPAVLSIGRLTVDPLRRVVTRADRELSLTPKEFGVLIELVRHPGAVVSAEELLDRVWDAHADPFTNAIRITVMTLRRKLGDPDPVETVIGVGYRLNPEVC